VPPRVTGLEVKARVSAQLLRTHRVLSAPFTVPSYHNLLCQKHALAHMLYAAASLHVTGHVLNGVTPSPVDQSCNQWIYYAITSGSDGNNFVTAQVEGLQASGMLFCCPIPTRFAAEGQQVPFCDFGK